MFINLVSNGKDRHINTDHIVEISTSKSGKSILYLDYWDYLNERTAQLVVDETPETIITKIKQQENQTII